jgi:hypothetical protein
VKKVVVVRKREDSGKQVQKSASLEVTVKFIASIGNGDRERSYEGWIQVIRDAVGAVAGQEGGLTRFTPTGGYYIVNGRVCLPEDFDPETKDFKPGTRSPLWASTEPEKRQWEILERIERDNAKPNTLARNEPRLLTLEETPRRRTVVVQRDQDFAWKDEEDGEDAADSITEEAAEKLVRRVQGRTVVVKRRTAD